MEEPQIKKSKMSSNHQMKVDRFMMWAKDIKIELNKKVKASDVGVSANFGMVATDDIVEGEVLFAMPNEATISPQTSKISKLILSNADELESPSGWVSLILILMYEVTSPDSKWRPYLDAFPNFSDMEQPMFWTSEEVCKELKGTGMDDALSRDLKNMEQEFNEIAFPFIKRHTDIFRDSRCQTFEFYKQMAAFIMAYSFTDNPPTTEEEDSDDEGEEPIRETIMVPMADLLNHVPNHNAELKQGEDTFRMVAIRDIKKGEEVYNTYGQLSNYTLLLMYGFAVPPTENPNNTVEIPYSVVRQACKLTNWPQLDDRWRLIELKGLEDSDSMCLHGEGLSDDRAVVQTLLMEEAEMKSRLAEVEKQGEDDWSDDEDDTDLSLDSLRSMGQQMKEMLRKMAELMASRLPEEDNSPDSVLPKKKLFARYVRQGQRRLLDSLKESLVYTVDNGKPS